MSQRIPNGSSSEVFPTYQSRRGTISLRYQLAEDGCAESQLALAKSLLSESGINREERLTNAVIAVHWLLRASEKGNVEAFCLLRECSDSGIGINCVNLFAVTKCLQLSETEVIARRVGYNIFSAIMSDTEETIAEELFQERIETLLTDEKKEIDVNISDNNDNNFESPQNINETSSSSTTTTESCISIKDVITSVKHCLEGSFPVVALRHVALYEEYKWVLLKYVYRLSDIFRRALILLIKDFGAVENLLAVVLYLTILYLLGHKSTFDVNITSGVFISSLIALVLMQTCSCYVANVNIEFMSINRWIDLIKLFEPTMNKDLMKQKFLQNTLSPLLIFLIVSGAFNFLCPSNLLKVISQELFIFSLLMFVLLDRSIKYGRQYVNISLLLNILVCLNKGNFLSDENFSYINYFNYQVHLPIYKEYEIHFNCLSCLSLPFMLPYLYWKMGCRSIKHGWQLVLLPHLMCLTWLNLAFNSYQIYETNDVFWSLCFWFTAFFFAYFIGTIPSLFLVLFAKSVYVEGIWSVYSSFLFISFFCLFICMFVVTRLSVLIGKRWLASILLAIFGLTVFMKSYSIGLSSASDPILSWEQYEMHCHRHAWYKSNTADVEIACLPLKGKQILLDGTVTAINIRDVENHASCFMSTFPSIISRMILFVFGDDFCKKENISPLEKDRCTLYANMNANAYQLQNWNTYTYSITLEVLSRASPEVILKVNHLCSSFIRTLKEGDSLHAIGILHASIGSSLPEIILQNGTCTSCYENIYCKTIDEPTPQFDFTSSFHRMVKFYLFPFIQAQLKQ